jgi:Rne/Rng family ribonuclease
MSKELFVSSTPHETKVAIVEEDQLTEVYFERENEYTLAGSIYKGRVTRVLPGMQSAFVNIGLERDAFLYVSDFLLDEEEEDAETLDHVVPRPYVVVAAPEARPDGAQEPIEAEASIPPYAGDEEEAGQVDHGAPAEAAGQNAETREVEREGSRKWKGRRRRGRGRDRFPEREGDRGAERPHDRVEQARVEHARPEHNRPEHDHVEHEPRTAETAHESRPAETFREARPQPPSPHQAVVLPGESISKYQPHSAQQPSTPAQVKAPTQTASQSTSRPSTEYSFDPSKFSRDSMVLPGETLAKYRGATTREAVPVAEEARPVAHIEPTEHVSTFMSPEPGPEIRHEAVERETIVPTVVEQAVATRDPHAGATSTSAETLTATGTDYGPHSRADRVVDEVEERQRFEDMNVAAVFGGAALETEDTFENAKETDAQVATHEAAEPAGHPDLQASQPESASGRGVMEEEEIEEEETDLPSFEDQLDLDDFEELEEEELAQFDEQLVPLGSDLTEAVRDAHTAERATGQYESEGLEQGEELEETAEAFDQAGEGENEDDLESSEQSEEIEEGSAEMRAPAPTAGYQQRAERRGDRRGDRRKPGRRMRGRPRPHVQRAFPAITDLLKEGQEILVQIAKEPIAKKGARITSHIALPGRFLVYMPTVHHTGVSRKIASEEDRQRLKRIVLSERGEAHGGFIVRTAAGAASEDDLRADIRFLINLWNEIRGRAESSKAPSLIYHDLNLVERILRDQVTTSFSAIWADSEQEYERILRFVSRFQSSLLKRVKLYTKDTPLFEQFNISEEINKALKSKVWLKSGGYIVINQTEALVAIDINTGKYVGKTARLEDTIVKTNIDAIKEIVRQIRLRDLGGIIVIDFIDMDERKNRQRVMQALEEALKADRAPSKVLQFNDFGLVAITRKRVKQSLERTLGQQCIACTGTGMIKSVSTVCNEIYVEMRKMARHFEHDIMLRVHPDVAKLLKSGGSHWIEEMEELTKHTILVKSDPLLHPEQFDIQ